MSAISLLVLLLMIFAAQLCKNPLENECGCIRQPTFEFNWLQTEYPEIAKQYTEDQFLAPVVTYPECKSIVTTCPNGYSVAGFIVETKKILVNSNIYPNPNTVLGIKCEAKKWYYDGQAETYDDKLKITFFSCKKD
ncbi:uncharacterized protein CELE_C35E7.7 [Caenorhabditis elegans]|uniref:Uncharacterized protein n=1 Tax=Caenorhabditis elegans TaxID=6239 RepID=O61769_CAEEL|nr:Uncharacterized protein CELE_C35E7.7 [Caenorhabditis elegans]CCD66814.1 Uncharacterized protein CELE_C35E7.7 [Caenorhabditis elegans]|eukprot:NP_492828.2 Uncharacterized protein CELE_C35E7.7 [Caenorhabditis elegans]